MKNYAIPIVLGIIVIAVGGFIVMAPERSDDANPVSPTETDVSTTGVTSTTTTTTTTTTPSGYTLVEVGTHKDASSCWSVINGKVYDLTAWVPKHPGGENAILGICGKDGSAKFNGKHGGATLQEGILEGYKIGVLFQ